VRPIITKKLARLDKTRAIALLLLLFNAWETKKVREKKQALLVARARELEKIRKLEKQ
jgi:hypothetical protein